jgi:muramoyltetrapeptide carboxypeptidase
MAPADQLRAAPVLQPGDRVRLLSPASYPTQEWLEESISILEGWDLVVEVGEHAMAKHGYMAGTDQQRLADLNDAFGDSGVRAIITTRGGAGSYRIADAINFDAVRADPKPVLGFSDITNVHLALWRHCQVGSIHGCLAGATAQAAVKQLLMTTEPITVRPDPGAYSAAIGAPGVASGTLVGGNLREVCHAIGTRAPNMAGCILFLEEFRTIGLGQIDRQLTQLSRSGILGEVAGIALGLITGFDDLVDRDWTLHHVLRDQLEGLGVPVLGGIFAGHGGVGADGNPDQTALPLGGHAVLDADAGTLTVGPIVG